MSETPAPSPSGGNALPEAIRSFSYILGSAWRDESNRNERLKRVLLAGGWQAWKRLVRKPVSVALFNGLRFRAYPECNSSSAVFYTRIPNFEPISFIRQHVQGGTLVDIGANVGMMSLLLADCFAAGWLFEPNPVAAARARENIRLNHLPFEVHEIALSDACGSIEFENRGGVNGCNRAVIGFRTENPTISVPRFTFDEFLEQHAPPAPITALKVDVEGHENAVFRGMERFLTRQRPRLIMFEYLQRTKITETFEIFSRAGYQILELTTKGPRRATVEVRPLQDLFACPEEQMAEFLRPAVEPDVHPSAAISAASSC